MNHYVGDKGILYTGTYGGNMRIVSAKQMRETPAPAKTLPRTSSIATDFLRAVREGRTDTAAGFAYSARLTEFTLLGNLAQLAGKVKRWNMGRAEHESDEPQRVESVGEAGIPQRLAGVAVA